MKIPFLQKSLVLAICAVLSIGVSSIAIADSTIKMDGSTGTRLEGGNVVPGNKLDLSGPGIIIIEGGGADPAKTNGTVNGPNLFFSFSQFSISAATDTVQFQCGGGLCGGLNATQVNEANITNVISRVTGGESTVINGMLKSNIGRGAANPANFWFFNPNGVAFGAGARVDVPAAFHIGAASQLIGDDGKEMWNAKNSTLSTATPKDFGFSGSTGDLTISGTTITIGHSTQLAAARDVSITNTHITAGTDTVGTLQISAQGNINVDKLSELNANLNAVQSLANSGIITGNATAGTTLTNNSAGAINGNATAGTTLTNSGTITGNATAGTDITNNPDGIIGTPTINKTATADNNLTNSGTINGGATATNGTLRNSKSITGKATGAAIENNNEGTIQGDAEASTYINNSVSITGNAKAGTYVINSGTIGNGATAGTDLTNSGTINGGATTKTGKLTNGSGLPKLGTINGGATATAGTLINNSGGTIDNGATAGTDLTNSGTINGGATARTGKLTNGTDLPKSGAINGGATAGTLINNSGGTIDNGATAGMDLTNSGTISGGATATNGTLRNSKSITGKATGAAIENNNGGTIQGDAEASTYINNSISITGNAKAGTYVINSGTIDNGATAGTDLTNSGTINGGATATKGTLTNSGTINGGIVQAGNDIKNTGPQAQINLNNQGKVSAQNNIEVNDGGKITINNTGENTVSAKKLTLGGSGIGTIGKTGTGKLTVDIQDDGITVNAGSKIEGSPPVNSSDEIKTTGDLDNSGTLTASTVQVFGKFKNNSGAMITANVIAEHTNPKDTKFEGNFNSDFSNSGKIDGNVAVNVTNKGEITGNATATTKGITLGDIVGNHKLSASLTNYGKIGGMATADTDITNNTGGTIGTNATAGKSLDNKGTITGNAIAQGNAIDTPRLVNSGTITGNAAATLGALTNNSGGLIGNGATAGTDLTNTGTINGNTTATSGALTNNGIITGDAEATAGPLTNTKQIIGNAIAKGNANGTPVLDNSGTITGGATATFGALTNRSTGIITGNASAKTGLTNEKSGKIGTSGADNKATAGSSLNNSGTIFGDAIADTTLTNDGTGAITGTATANGDATITPRLDNSGTITGDATATFGALTNRSTGIITGNASAKTNLTNEKSGNIGTSGAGNKASAGTTLNNSGTITGDATAVTLLDNNGGTIGKDATVSNGSLVNRALSTIKGKATTKTFIDNTGTIEGDAEAATVLTNNAGGTIGTNATNKASAGTTLNNTGTITGDATAVILLDNNGGTIGKDATVSNGSLVNRALSAIKGKATTKTFIDNTGTIEGDAVAATVLTNNAGGTIGTNATNKASAGTTLNNSGTITGDATAVTLLDNNGGTIGKNATVSNGSLVNRALSTIKGKATTKTFIDNTGTIEGNAEAGTDITNNTDGTIGNGATASNDIINNGVISGTTIQAGRDLTNTGSKALINLDQELGTVSVARDLLVDEGGKIIASNSSNTLISAGSILNGNTPIVSTTGGNLTVAKGGVIEKSGGSGTFTVEAKQFNGNGGKLTVTGGSSHISTTKNHDGIAKVAADTELLVEQGAINLANQNDAAITAGTLLGVSNAGTITAANNGLFTVLAGSDLTVTGQDSQINTTAGHTGAAKVAAGAALLVDQEGAINLANTGKAEIIGNTISADNAAISVSNQGDAAITAGTLLGVSAGTITATNKGLFTVLAGSNLTVTDSKITANNLEGNASIISAGSILTGNTTAVSTTGGDLTVADSGVIEKSAGSGTFTVAAKQVNGNGGKLTVTGADSKINTAATHTGTAMVAADTALLVESNGAIDLANSGTADVTGGTVTVDTTGAINFANTGEANVLAGTTLDVGNKGTIKSTNGGNFNVLAGSDLTVQGADSKITANNTGANAATVIAGRTLDATNTLQPTTTGGNLLVASGGQIEKTAGGGAFSVAAKQGTVTTTTGKLTVTGADSATGANSKINTAATHTGTAMVAADTALLVESNGAIDLANSGTADVTGGTVTVDTTGAINFANTGEANVLAGTTLDVGNKGTIKSANGGNFNVLAGSDLTVQGADSKIAANNKGVYAATVSAGRVLDPTINTLQASTTGGNLLVASGGLIEKTAGGGAFSVAAKQGTVTTTTGKLTVTGADSKINTAATHTGTAIVAADTALLVESNGAIDLANSGTADVTGGTVTVDTTGAINLANTGVANVLAGTTLVVGNKGTIKSINGGNFNVLAGSDLTVQGADSKITANNSGANAATVSAGRVLDPTINTLQASTTGGNLLVASGGLIEKTAGGGAFSVAAKQGTVTTTTGKLTVTGADSKINTAATHTGTAIVAADTALLVESNGAIDLANSGTVDVTGGTVTVDTTGAINLANTGVASVLAGTTLVVGNKGTIKSINGGNFNVLAGSDLTVQGADSKITANNTGDNAAKVIAGRTLDATNTLQPTTTGGNLLVASGGLIEKTAGGGVFSVAAKQGTVTTTTGKLTVTGANSKINTAATHTGTAIVAADTGLLVENNGAIDLANTGTADVTGGTVTVDTTGAINLTNTIDANVLAGTTLVVGNKGTIKSINGGNFNVLAGSDLTVQGADSKITANNSGANAATVIAGRTLDATNTLQPTTTGGNLLVASGGLIEKTAGGGAFSVAAKQGTVTTTGKLTVTGADSKINTAATHTGTAIVAADTALLVESNGAIDLANSGTADVTGGTVTIDTTGAINLANTGEANVLAGTTLVVGNKGTIKSINGGNFNVLAGSDLTVQGADSKITANNTGDNAATVIAGRTLDATNTLQPTTTGGNLLVASGGLIEKTAGGGAFSVEAKRGTVTITTGKLTVTGESSQINATAGHTGAVKVAADSNLLVEQKGAINLANTGIADVIGNTISADNAAISFSNQGDAAISAGTALGVSNAGTITAANNGLFTALAGSDLTVTGAASKITANNLADNASIISAGNILNNNTPAVSTTGGNLTVANGGVIEKSASSGAFSVEAKQVNGNGGKLTVTGAGSQINTTAGHAGVTKVAADTGLLVEQKGAINLANTGKADVSGNTISVDNAAISVSNQDVADITARTALVISNAGTITAANNGFFSVLAESNLTVTGAASKITANNLAANASIISVASILNNNTPAVSTTGRDLTVSNGGGIEKTSGTGAFTIEAKGNTDAGGKSVAGNLTVTGSNAKIETTQTYKGIAKVTADAVLLVDQGGNINLANDNNAEIFAGDTLRVDNTGKISTSNTGLSSINAANGITVGSAGAGVIEKTAGISDFVIKTQTGSLKVSNTGSRISDSSSDAGNMTVEAESLAVTNNAAIEKTGTGTGQLAVRINPNGIVIGSGAKIAATQNNKSNVIDTSGSIDNRGTLTADTIHAAGIINNFAEGDMTGSVTSDLQFINEGTLTGNVNTTSSTGTDINNSGTINGAVNALANVNNKGKITGKVNAGNNVSNSGAITGIIEAEQNVDNLSGGTITGKATAKNAAVTNNGTIDGGADGGIKAGTDVLNFALINSNSIQAAQDIKTIGSAAQTNLNKEGAALLSAGRDVLVDQGGKITASNTGDTTISAAGTLDVIDSGSIQLANTGTASVTAGGKFTISNAGSIRAANTGAFYALAGDTLSIQTGGKLIADNSGVSAATVSAGTVSDSTGQLLASNTGGNLLVQTGGAIEKNTGSGDFTLAARRSDSDGGQLVVEGSGSKISVAHLGSLIIYPDALVPRKFIGNNNQFSDVNNKAQYAFRVSDGGVINKNNLGDMNVTAQTVYLGGLTAIAGTTTGTLEFISVIKEELNNEARLPRYFKMQDSTITNFGPVSISEYFLNLDPSGIKSNTSITLNVFNSADIAFPKVLIGRGSSASALQSGKSFLDAPSNAKILINNRISLNPEDNISTLTRNILASAFVSNVLIPPMPKNPCDKRSQSTLNSKGAVASYIPEISSQVPYSILATTTGASSSLSALPASPLALAILDVSDECQ